MRKSWPGAETRERRDVTAIKCDAPQQQVIKPGTKTRLRKGTRLFYCCQSNLFELGRQYLLLISHTIGYLSSISIIYPMITESFVIKWWKLFENEGRSNLGPI